MDELAADRATRDRAQDVQSVWRALDTVKDPEIPVISVVEMGMIADVRLSEGRVLVEVTPTFAGCPALDLIGQEIRRAVAEAGYDDIRVKTVYDPPWTSDRVTPEGRRKLKAFGLAPPDRCGSAELTAEALSRVTCPYCDSGDTTLESIFGSTLCRAIHYCNACSQSFEQFKPVG